MTPSLLPFNLRNKTCVDSWVRRNLQSLWQFVVVVVVPHGDSPGAYAVEVGFKLRGEVEDGLNGNECSHAQLRELRHVVKTVGLRGLYDVVKQALLCR